MRVVHVITIFFCTLFDFSVILIDRNKHNAIFFLRLNNVWLTMSIINIHTADTTLVMNWGVSLYGISRYRVCESEYQRSRQSLLLFFSHFQIYDKLNRTMMNGRCATERKSETKWFEWQRKKNCPTIFGPWIISFTI